LKELILLTGKDCHLCSYAKSLLSNLELEDYLIKEVDIYSKRIYLDNYWNKIPVLLLKEKELFWPFDKEKIYNFLD
jgi:glutaredoxin